MDASRPSVSYVRGPDLGGGVGGLVASLRVAPRVRDGDTALQREQRAWGHRGAERWSGTNDLDSQLRSLWAAPCGDGTRPDPAARQLQGGRPGTGLLNEGFRYWDLETGTWLSRDPAGFVDDQTCMPM